MVCVAAKFILSPKWLNEWISHDILREIMKHHLHNKVFIRLENDLPSEQAKEKRKVGPQKLPRRIRKNCRTEFLFTEEKIFTVRKVVNKQGDKICIKLKEREVMQR